MARDEWLCLRSCCLEIRLEMDESRLGASTRLGTLKPLAGSLVLCAVSVYRLARRFRWRNKADGTTTTQVLEHGSLLVMPPGFQRDYLHELPKQQKVSGSRINLTFRRRLR